MSGKLWYVSRCMVAMVLEKFLDQSLKHRLAVFVKPSVCLLCVLMYSVLLHM